MANFLVTGAAGFIASRVCEMALEQGHAVLGCDNLNPYYDVRLKEWRLSKLRQYPDFRFVHADISNKKALDEVFSLIEADTVFNLAARAGVRASVEDPWIYLETNTLGTLNVLELCRKNDVRKHVLASTSSLYGKENPVPYDEAANTDAPLSPYAASKKSAEVFASTYHNLHGLSSTVLRFFTVYGPAGRPDMAVFRFIRWIAENEPVRMLGDGMQERDFTFVDDVARGTLSAGKTPGFATVNLGNNSPRTLNNLVEIIEQQMDKKARVIRAPSDSSDMPRTWANIERAKRILGWSPEVTFEVGIARSIEWYLKNREFARGLKI